MLFSSWFFGFDSRERAGLRAADQTRAADQRQQQGAAWQVLIGEALVDVPIAY
jgi:hypothetical protein